MTMYGTQTSVDLKEYAKSVNAIIVDLRSDTLTTPTDKMKQAMYEAEVGDDVYGEDPTVKKLEKTAAQMLGKEDAIFVSSGTMSNLIAIMNHCDVRGSEAYVGFQSHTFVHEQGGAAQIAGVTLCPIPNEVDGTFDLKLLESCIRKDELHEPISKLVIVENTINGKVVPLKWIQDLHFLAKKHKLKMHLDGARFWNAVVASGVPAREIASYFDSVTFCLSKGLGSPVGSVLCGTNSFIKNAKRRRKVLGGGMRQVGILAAAGLVALNDTIPILKKDHEKAFAFATEINKIGTDLGFTVDINTVQTNMVFMNIREDVTVSKEFLQRLENTQDDTDKIIIRALALSDSSVRFVFYHQILEENLHDAIKKIKNVILSYKK